jgi:hypothetical protein
MGEAAEHDIASIFYGRGVKLLKVKFCGTLQKFEDFGNWLSVVLARRTIGNPCLRV